MMIAINLLPHREIRREKQKRAFYATTIASLILGALLVFFGWSVYESMIGSQRGRNQYIADANRKLDVQIKEIASLREEIEALKARQRAVEDLQADRNQPVDLFNDLFAQVPDGIVLKQIKQQGIKINAAGQAVSNERVSEFLRNLQDNSKYLDGPELIEIKLAGPVPNQPRRRFDFSLNFNLRQTPERAELAAQQAQTGAAKKPAAAPAGKTAGKN
jgi:type IV pilus assembly protein PilN